MNLQHCYSSQAWSSRNQTTYIQAIENCCSRYPDLHKFRDFLKDQKPDLHPRKAAVPQQLSPPVNDDSLFTQRYYEVVRNPDVVNRSVGLKTVSKVHDKKTLSHFQRNTEAGDHFFEKEDDLKQGVFVTRRNVSFWSRKRKIGGAGKDAG